MLKQSACAMALAIPLLMNPCFAVQNAQVEYEVKAVEAQIKPTFAQLKIELVDVAVRMVHGTAAGISKRGSRVVVSFTQKGPGNTKIAVATDNPEDEALEKALLEALQSALKEDEAPEES